MLFSKALARELVSHLMFSPKLDMRKAQHLMYHLKFPGDGVGLCLAEAIVERNPTAELNRVLISRLAAAVVYDCLELFDPGMRHDHQARLGRQISKVSLILCQNNYPHAFESRFDDRLSLLFIAQNAARDLATEVRSLSSQESVLFVEQLITAYLEERDLVELLIERLVKTLRHEEKTRLRLRLRETVNQAKVQIPWEDDEPIKGVLTLDTAARFKESLVTNPQFAPGVETLLTFISRVCS